MTLRSIRISYQFNLPVTVGCLNLSRIKRMLVSRSTQARYSCPNRTKDLHEILSTPDLQHAIVHSPETAHASLQASTAPLQTLLAQNVQLAESESGPRTSIPQLADVQNATMLNIHFPWIAGGGARELPSSAGNNALFPAANFFCHSGSLCADSDGIPAFVCFATAQWAPAELPS